SGGVDDGDVGGLVGDEEVVGGGGHAVGPPVGGVVPGEGAGATVPDFCRAGRRDDESGRVGGAVVGRTGVGDAGRRGDSRGVAERAAGRRGDGGGHGVRDGAAGGEADALA